MKDWRCCNGLLNCTTFAGFSFGVGGGATGMYLYMHVSMNVCICLLDERLESSFSGHETRVRTSPWSICQEGDFPDVIDLDRGR